MAGRHSSQQQAWQQAYKTESTYLQMQARSRESNLEGVRGF